MGFPTEWPAHFTRFVEPRSDGCWWWVGTLRPDGYGVHWIPVEKRLRRAHRYGWMLLHPDVDPSAKIDIDHLCRVKRCVNPAHLEGVTHRENMLRGVGPIPERARQTHCKRGHPLSGENLGVYAKGTRHCRTCMKQNAADRRAGLRNSGTCSEPGCGAPVNSKGLCVKHYDRIRNAMVRDAKNAAKQGATSPGPP